MAARRQHGIAAADILADLDDIFAGGRGLEEFDARVINFLGILDHDDRVRVVRDHAAGVDQRGFAHAKLDRADRAHGHFAGHGQEGGQAGRRAVGVGCVDRVAVDRGAAEVGQVLGGIELFGQHAIQRIGRGDTFRFDDRREVFQKEHPRFGRRAHGE